MYKCQPGIWFALSARLESDALHITHQTINNDTQWETYTMMVANYIRPAYCVLFAASLLLSACGGGSNKPEPDPTPFPPTPTPDLGFHINAGEDLAVAEKTTVTLTGEANDPNDSVSDIQWTQTSGPLLILQNADTLSPSFIAPSISESTVILLSLSVTNANETLSDSVAVVVNPVFDLEPVFPPTQAAYTGPVIDITGTVDNYEGDLEGLTVTLTHGANQYFATIEDGGFWRAEGIELSTNDGKAMIEVIATDSSDNQDQYTIELTTEPNIAEGDDLIYDVHRNQFYVFSSRDKQLVKIDSDGNREILLASAPFAGESLDCAVYNDNINPTNDRIYCSQSGEIYAVNPTTGQPELMTDSFETIDQIVADPSNQTLYVFQMGNIYSVDINTFIAEPISDFLTGSGPPFLFFARDAILDLDDNRLVAHDGYALYTFNLETQERIIVEDDFGSVAFEGAPLPNPDDPFSFVSFDIIKMAMDIASDTIYFYNKDDDAFYMYNLDIGSGSKLAIDTTVAPYENTGTVGFYYDPIDQQLFILKDIYDYIVTYQLNDGSSELFSAINIGGSTTMNYGFDQLDLDKSNQTLYTFYARDDIGSDDNPAIPFMQFTAISPETSARTELALLQRETYTFGEFKVDRVGSNLYYLFEGELFMHNLRTDNITSISNNGQGYADDFIYNGGSLFIDSTNNQAIYCKYDGGIYTVNLDNGERSEVALMTENQESLQAAIRLQDICLNFYGHP